MRDNTAGRKLWAKKGTDLFWLPLTVHMSDAAEAMRLLWDTWLSGGIARQIADGVSIHGRPADREHARQVMIFLAAAHDLGKASPVFQSKRSVPNPNRELDEYLRQLLAEAKLPLKNRYDGGAKTHHTLVSHEILRRNKMDDSTAVVLSGHHGKPPNSQCLCDLGAFRSDCGFDSAEWREVQDELFTFALSLSGLTADAAVGIKLSRPAQALSTGLVILTDWIASDGALFPLIKEDCRADDSARRADWAFAALELPDGWTPEPDWDGIYQRRFEIRAARPVQTEALKAAQNCRKPGMMVIEAPMGEGKTEAALAAAEVFAYKAKRRGVYFALPTQATSNAMFARVLDWIQKLDHSGKRYGIRLCHGKADLNETYQDLPHAIRLSDRVSMEDGEVAFVHEWLSGRKKGLLTDFTIGTIDHVLMAGLKQKHLVLRHLGLAGKVIIIDEAHAYDAYMNSYLLTVLKWLGAYGVPVIVLSATFPAMRRREMIQAYLNTSVSPPWADTLAYPLITCTDGNEIRQVEVQGACRALTVEIQKIDDGALVEALDKALAGGGCAGVIVNTVGRAQEIFSQLVDRFGSDCVKLLHSRFLACDRSVIEDKLSKLLGPPGKARRPEGPDKLIVVGTQVLEQSLDFDFDILITDLCPMDLLLQRVGRLHRHTRARPETLKHPVCLVMGADGGKLESGAAAVYGEYLLLRTREILPERVTLPGDIPRLVAGVYDESGGIALRSVGEAEFQNARDAWILEQMKRKRRARLFQVSPPECEEETLIDWFINELRDDSEKRGEAAVRDGADSVEVVVIARRGNGLYLLPWICGGQVIPITKPDDALAKKIAACTVRLPALFGGKWIIDTVIDELESVMASEGLVRGWYASPFLKGCLCLILDESLETTLCGYRLKYDRKLGLSHEKEEKS